MKTCAQTLSSAGSSKTGLTRWFYGTNLLSYGGGLFPSFPSALPLIRPSPDPQRPIPGWCLTCTNTSSFFLPSFIACSHTLPLLPFSPTAVWEEEAPCGQPGSRKATCPIRSTKINAPLTSSGCTPLNTRDQVIMSPVASYCTAPHSPFPSLCSQPFGVPPWRKGRKRHQWNHHTE